MTASHPNPLERQGGEFPTALVQPETTWGKWLRGSTRWFWLLSLACFGFAFILALRSAALVGPQISISFDEGHGLKAEDAVQYRGIDVGQVESITLRKDHRGVDVQIRLNHDAATLAREGSQFWIERPQLSLTRMSGLETVVGAKFVGVIPADTNAPRCDEFVGIETPPTLRQLSDVTVVIHFQDGSGITPGNVVKYRGIEVGEVTEVRLEDDLSGVQVRAKLTAGAQTLARQGTLFWVERPNVSLKGIRGLDTLVGGQYLAVLPDPAASVAQFEFEGRADPPPVLDAAEGGLHITLTSEERYGLERGAPITYRGMPAGQVTLVELAASGHLVEVRAVIFKNYANLVRDNSRFWSRSGVDFHLGLGGMDLDLDPLTSLTHSGIAFATPDALGGLIESGHRFDLEEKEVDNWKDWKPVWEATKAVSEAIKNRRKGERPFLDRLRARFGMEAADRGDE